MWETRFNERFGVIHDDIIPFSEQYDAADFKKFIRETLAADRNSLIEKIEELSARMCKETVNQSATETLIKRAYQEALDDVLKLVRE